MPNRKLRSNNFCFALLTLLLVGCVVNPTQGITFVPQDTASLPAVEQHPTGSTPLQTPPSTQTQSPMFTPSATSTQTATSTASPTPRFDFDLSGYDTDLYQPIDVSHNPPLIARSDETLELVFDFANLICMQFPVSCMPEGVLYFSFGDEEAFQSVPLTHEIVDEMDSLVARMPAADEDGKSLRYYAEFSVPEAGYTQRYPVAGTIQVFAAASFISIELPVQNEAMPGEEVYDFFWGFGPGEVRQATYEGYPMRVGPPALDVASDGSIALLDPVNERVLIYDPAEDRYSSVVLPFTYKSQGDLAFDRSDRLMICDLQGEEVEGAFAPLPHCFRLTADWELAGSAPLYVRSPSKITREHQVLDYYDGRLVVPFDPAGQANSREVQREKLTWEFTRQYVKGLDPYVARFADVKEGMAFEVHSASPLGVLSEFERTPQGYLMTFTIGDQIRAVWIDASGKLLKDVTLPAGYYSEINFNAQVAVGQDGSLYVLGSTERGMEVHTVGAP